MIGTAAFQTSRYSQLRSMESSDRRCGLSNHGVNRLGLGHSMSASSAAVVCCDRTACVGCWMIDLAVPAGMIAGLIDSFHRWM